MSLSAGPSVVFGTFDDAGANRTVQGSLRQFIQNSNALEGLNSSQFAIATTDSNYNGSGNGEFTIRPVSSLPDLIDDRTVLVQDQFCGQAIPIGFLIPNLQQ